MNIWKCIIGSMEMNKLVDDMHGLGVVSDILPCSYCLGKPDKRNIGNSYTKSRGVEIRCRKCNVKIKIVSSLYVIEWAEWKAVGAWNMMSKKEDEL